MSQEYKKIGGIALIAFGVLMLFSMMGASLARTRAYHTRMAMAEAAAVQAAPAADAVESGTQNAPTNAAKSWHGAHHRPGPGMGFARGGHSPFLFIGGLFRMLALGIIAFFILRYLKVRKHKGRDPVAKIIDEDDVETDIRVGDEIDNESGAIDPDEMSVDDLVRAMKRLGIKKLEL